MKIDIFIGVDVMKVAISIVIDGVMHIMLQHFAKKSATVFEDISFFIGKIKVNFI